MATDLITYTTLSLKSKLGTLNRFIVLPKWEKKEEDPLLCVSPHYSPESQKELFFFQHHQVRKHNHTRDCIRCIYCG